MSKGVLRHVLPVLLAIGLLWYVLKDVPLGELATQFQRANYQWLLVAALTITLYHVVRAMRWQLALQALGYRPSLFRTTIALLVGSIASMLIPGAGELTRCGTLQRTDGVPLAQGIGSVVAERIVDLLTLVLVIALTVLLEYKRVGHYMADLAAPALSQFAGHGPSPVGLALLATFCLLLFAGLYKLLSSEAFWKHRLVVRATSIAIGLKRGFLSIQQLKNPGLYITLSMVSYGFIFLTNYVLFFASPQTIDLPPTAALTILTVSSLGGLAVPTQGGLGTYHFFVSRALVLYGMSLTDGVLTATFLHAVQTGFSLFLSSISFLIVPILLRQKSRRLHLEKPAP